MPRNRVDSKFYNSRSTHAVPPSNYTCPTRIPGEGKSYSIKLTGQIFEMTV